MKPVDPQRALLQALGVRYPTLVVTTIATQPWASVTFTGARHVLSCMGEADLTGIEEEEFTLRNHIVADIVYCRDGDRTILEALTIEAA